MGKGDKKTKKGKIALGSFGVSRPTKKAPTVTPKSPEKPKAEAEAKPAKTASKAPAKKKSKEEKEK